MEGVVSQPSMSTDEKLILSFQEADLDHDGQISPQEYEKYLQKNFLVLFLFPGCFEKADENKDGFLDQAEFKTCIRLMAEKLFQTSWNVTEEKFKEVMEPFLSLTQSNECTIHTFDIAIGDISNPPKTKLEIKGLLNSKDEEKHLEHIAKDVNFTKSDTGLIFRIKSSNPEKTAEKLKNIINEAKELVNSSFHESNHIHKIVNYPQIEVGFDEERVTLLVKIPKDCTSFYLLYNLLFMETYIQNFSGETNFKLSFNNDFHDVLEETNGLNFIKHGTHLRIQTKLSNYKLPKRIINAMPNIPHFVKVIKAMVSTFLQKNFNLELKIEDVDLEDFLNEHEIKNSNFDWDKIATLMKPILATLKNSPLPILQQFLDLLREEMQANISISLHIWNYIVTIHFKTSGIKEFIEKLNEKAGL